MRFIPRVMMTQHPDSANKYVPIQEEPEEAIFALTPQPQGLGMEEVMVDYEGKLTPYHQLAQIALGLLKEKLKSGKEVFITPRVASATAETVFRQLMALLSIMETNYLTYNEIGGFAIKEFIVPMCERPQDILAVKKRVSNVIRLAHQEYLLAEDPDAIQVIPLIEDVPGLLEADRILGNYLRMCREEGFKVKYLRYMVGRSDPALAYGMVPSVLASKVAISEIRKMGDELNIKVYPVLGAGALPFRGHVTLENIENVLREYAGIYTLTIQSGMRYDHGFEETRQLCSLLTQKIPFFPSLDYTSGEIKEMINIIGVFFKNYLSTFMKIFPLINRISDLLPRQRDRLQRISPVGYARDIARPEKILPFISDERLREEIKGLQVREKGDLPRAITYTGALYTIGFPPEFIGTGRALEEIEKRYGEKLLEKLINYYYPSIKKDLAAAYKYLSMENARLFLPPEALAELEEDIKVATRYFSLKKVEMTEQNNLYHLLMETARPLLKQEIGLGDRLFEEEEAEKKLLQSLLVKMGRLRKSLG
ncbi:MAG: phosphoenolpyruvate carboxylase [Candidatus Syntrophonatronum acetioxidans]|uniref:Phosphoenolpyruvate carboxylase n=1 Tax=Candidatus Syntrophonatronum acetioxidans TaxID=1795816 RepID=A0A424YCR4_9FIRM|nr:MAG: phosphoenolpyruvate carboxylase [Candidatus Syntrophonatronum acetioxidans]